MNTFQLKLLAVILMVIDHIGFFIFPDVVTFRIIGRLSYPIFAYLITVGFNYTKNPIKYFMRLFIFACIIQFPSLFMDIPINIFFTLSLGLLLLIIHTRYESIGLRLLMMIGVLLLTDILSPDYSVYGVMLIYLLYILKPIYQKIIGMILLSILYYGLFNIQVFSVLALIPIYFYNQKEGPKWKIFFYTFYPVHLVILQWISLNI
ncbi:MAG: hypothetical protein JXR88_11755 [Clostridia bacterium]|nr:hypothetical protein [Clostridia bacterium]